MTRPASRTKTPGRVGEWHRSTTAEPEALATPPAPGSDPSDATGRRPPVADILTRSAPPDRVPLPNPVEEASAAELGQRVLLALSLLGHPPTTLPTTALPWCELLRRALLGDTITALASEQVRD